MSEEQSKVEVRVGGYTARGEFLGEVVRFAGESLGTWTDFTAATSNDDRGVDYTLFRCEQDAYRLHIFEWSRWQGEESEARLLPIRHGEPAEGGESANTYSTLSEEQARQRWGRIFAALGMPNTTTID